VYVVLLFADEKLRQLCNVERVAKRQLGEKNAQKLRSRLADLDAATRVTDLMAGRPHPLKRDRLGQFALDLDAGCRLVFEPANDPVPLRHDGSTDWSRVTSVRIVYIGDYHD